MNLETYTRFAVCSMIWSVLLISIVLVSTLLVDPRNTGDVPSVLFIVIGIGVLIAIPIGGVTWLAGQPIQLWAYRRCEGKYGRFAVPMAGATLAIGPSLLLCFVFGGDFDAIGSPLLNVIPIFLIGIGVGAITAHYLLRPNVSMEFEE